jgi:hypothetical protein
MPPSVDTTERTIEPHSRKARIRLRAQELYKQRGDRPGSAIEDWLRAEEQIREAEEQAIDESLEYSFPASDPPAH